uniref:hypothetical protein n=1 Tax=Arsenophonus nasoniae TaxID=638 RepID=UPI0010840E2B|nr:hypothetical protein [Arsenophonus nasoniae]
MPHLLWPFNNNWPLLNALFRQPLSYAAVGSQTGYRNWYFCALHTYGPITQSTSACSCFRVTEGFG